MPALWPFAMSGQGSPKASRVRTRSPDFPAIVASRCSRCYERSRTRGCGCRAPRRCRASSRSASSREGFMAAVTGKARTGRPEPATAERRPRGRPSRRPRSQSRLARGKSDTDRHHRPIIRALANDDRSPSCGRRSSDSLVASGAATLLPSWRSSAPSCSRSSLSRRHRPASSRRNASRRVRTTTSTAIVRQIVMIAPAAPSPVWRNRHPC